MTLCWHNMPEYAYWTSAEISIGAIRNIAFTNSMLLYPSMWARMRDFMAAPDALKTYLRDHCSDEVIDTSKPTWGSLWEDAWSLYHKPGKINACVNTTYVAEYNR